MMKRLLIFGILILTLSSKEAITSSLADLLYLEKATQTTGTVTSIVDGDTIEVALPDTTTTKVRLLGINAPEMLDEPFAREARDFTAQLLNQSIELFYSKDPKLQKDKNGRLLAVIVKDEEIFNIKPLEQGLAVRMFIFNDIIKFPAWEDVEVEARGQRLNIWSNINSRGIFINEINPNPHPEPDNEAEFVELYNDTPTGVDVSNWRFVCIHNEVIIPNETTIPGKGYLIITSVDAHRFREIYHHTPEGTIIINGKGNLILRNKYNPKENLAIHLRAEDKSYQDSLTYNLNWDNKKANGTGRTLERKSLSITNVGESKLGDVDDDNWNPSITPKGTPGRPNSASSPRLSIASWIMGCQRHTGAICIYKDQKRVMPYDANIGAYGLLEFPGYEDIVKKWMDWYFSHINDDGTIYDYEVEDGIEISLDFCDSEDAYAGTFLSLAWKYYQKTGNLQYLKDHKETLTKIANVICNLQQEDGLTWAKEDYKVKYMMDNCESYGGLKDYARLCIEAFKDSTLGNLYNDAAERIKSAILNKWWDEERKGFVWAEHANGAQARCNWSRFYPDAASQLWTIHHGIIQPRETLAQAIYDTCNSYHDWPLFPRDKRLCGGVAYVAALMGDKERVSNYKESLKIGFEEKDYPWPWNCRDAGRYLSMEKRIVNSLPTCNITSPPANNWYRGIITTLLHCDASPEENG